MWIQLCHPLQLLHEHVAVHTIFFHYDKNWSILLVRNREIPFRREMSDSKLGNKLRWLVD